MKAISVQQPWANMIRDGDKAVETRSWRTDYRGDLVICSSKWPKIEPAGYALAIVRLVDCVPMIEGHIEAARCEVYPGAWAWILDDIRPVEPVKVTGQLGFFDIDEGLIEVRKN